MGAGFGTLVCYFFPTFFGLAALGKETHMELRLFRLFGKPFLASVAAAAAGWQVSHLVQRVLPGRWEALFSMAAFVLVYGFCVLFLRILRKSDLQALPGTEKITKILEKHHWIGYNKL